jgi:hypothetical protein
MPVSRLKTAALPTYRLAPRAENRAQGSRFPAAGVIYRWIISAREGIVIKTDPQHRCGQVGHVSIRKQQDFDFSQVSGRALEYRAASIEDAEPLSLVTAGFLARRRRQDGPPK